MKQIQSIAPVRVDLAGGTVDIWPLYLLLDNAKTLNYGIDLFATTTLDIDSESSSPSVTLESLDLKHSQTFSWNEVVDSKKEHHAALEIPARLLQYFAKQYPHIQNQSVHLKTSAKSPSGAGLGGSSALSISIIGALRTWVLPNQAIDLEKEAEFLISLTRDVESQVLFGPAGLQDYYGAAFGGLQALDWKIAKNERRPLSKEILQALDDRTLLFYSGKSRNSGINNWQLFKGLIDRDPEVTRKFNRIVEATHEIEAALFKQDYLAAVKGVQREWNTRKTLAPGISTPEMEAAYHRAQEISDIAFKVCGAGGGGCFFIMTPDANPETLERIRSAVLSDPSIQALRFHTVDHGLKVTTS